MDDCSGPAPSLASPRSATWSRPTTVHSQSSSAHWPRCSLPCRRMPTRWREQPRRAVRAATHTRQWSNPLHLPRTCEEPRAFERTSLGFVSLRPCPPFWGRRRLYRTSPPQGQESRCAVSGRSASFQYTHSSRKSQPPQEKNFRVGPGLPWIPPPTAPTSSRLEFGTPPALSLSSHPPALIRQASPPVLALLAHHHLDQLRLPRTPPLPTWRNRSLEPGVCLSGQLIPPITRLTRWRSL